MGAFATLGHPAPQLFDAVAMKTLERLDAFNSQSIANTVWAFAKLRHPALQLFDAVALKALERLDAFNSQEIANTVWAFATLRHPSLKFFDAVSRHGTKGNSSVAHVEAHVE